MESRKEEEKRIIEERRNEKLYDREMYNLKNGYLIQKEILKHETADSDEKRIQSEWIADRNKGVKERFKKLKRYTKKSKYPKDKQIILRTKRSYQLSRILQIILTLIDPEEIYMYDPTCSGTGYKYYKGENVIVYQVEKYTSRWEKSRLCEQLEKNVVKNSSGMLFNIKDKWKIILVTNTKWNVKNNDGWKDYSIKQGYIDTLNVFTHQVNEPTKVLDTSTEMTRYLNELDNNYL